MKKVLKILTLIMLILAILKIGDTYAKYFAEANTGTLTQEVGKWVIKINNMDIYSEDGETIQFPLNNFTNATNQNTAPNKISPGSEGYVDIFIDPTGTDVAVRYDIELEQTQTSNLAIAARLGMASGENTLVRTGEKTYTGIISLADVQEGKMADVRCFIKWENDEANNEADSALGSQQDVTLEVLAKVTVTQYLGEPITEYVEPEVSEETT